MPYTLVVPEINLFDERTNEFIEIPGQEIKIEHSLVSLSKWETKWCVPFLTKEAKTDEQIRDYVRCMTLTQNVKPEIYEFMPSQIVNEALEYINAQSTATTIKKDNAPPSRQIITSELIYGWMVTLNIPFECQKWHLNRLMMLIQVVNRLNAPSKKMPRNEMLAERRALNASRRKRLGTKG